MERITFEQALMAQRPRFAEKFMENVQLDNMVLETLKEYPSGMYLQCKEISKKKFNGWYPPQRIACSLKRLIKMGLVKRVVFEEKPLMIKAWLPKKVTVDGVDYYSRDYFEQEISVTPKIARYTAI